MQTRQLNYIRHQPWPPLPPQDEVVTRHISRVPSSFGGTPYSNLVPPHVSCRACLPRLVGRPACSSTRTSARGSPPPSSSRPRESGSRRGAGSTGTTGTRAPGHGEAAAMAPAPEAAGAEVEVERIKVVATVVAVAAAPRPRLNRRQNTGVVTHLRCHHHRVPAATRAGRGGVRRCVPCGIPPTTVIAVGLPPGPRPRDVALLLVMMMILLHVEAWCSWVYLWTFLVR